MSQNDYSKRYQQTSTHLFDFGLYNVYDNNIINLSVGAPGPDLLANCCELFNEATKHRMSLELASKSTLFQYGPAIGRLDIRNSFAKYLTEEYKEKVYGEDIVITTGATQGLHLILSTLIDFSGVIFVDEVTYMIALSAMSQFTTMKIVTVPLTKDGVDIEALRKLTAQYKFESKTKMFWGMYYTIPVFHNPTGLLYSEELCKQLVTLSRENDFLITCDDVYNTLYYGTGSPPKRLYAYDDRNDADYKGHVISNGSFSKILSPGVRVGWMECPSRCARLFDESGIMRSGGATNNYTSGIVASLIELGLAKQHLNMSRNKYKARMAIACKVLRENLPTNCTFTEPEGGFFIWVTFPDNVVAADLNRFCMEKYKVTAIAGDTFSSDGKFKNCLRITIGFHSEENLANGLEKLCKAYGEFVAN
ncbi:hypothetical protein HA402_014848 [Bradysia odoriphaga]|nr:hypothetical protein HA402_014848 [Bradysia odoriphaga]